MRRRHFLCTAALVVLLGSTASAEQVKVLIVDGQNNHAWPDTTPVLQAMLEESGLFTVDVATAPPKGEDNGGFLPDFFVYDVVVSNYNGEDWSEATNEAFVDYVRGGGGLVSYHAADNSFPNWIEYNEMIAVGGWGKRDETAGPYLYWKDGKPVRDHGPGKCGSHGAKLPFQINVRNTSHAITKGLPENFMHVGDELYARLRGPAKNVTILATAFSDLENKGTGRDEPMLMAITFGKGRVFHTTLGHAVEQCHSVAFICTFLRGTEWAATGEVSQTVPDDFPTAEESTTRP